MRVHTVVLFILGVVMLGLALGLDAMMDLHVSGWIQLLAAAFGIYLIVMAWFSLRFDERRAKALEEGAPVSAEVEVTRMSDGDSAAYLANVKVADETWTVPLRMTRRVRKLVKAGELAAQAWMDEEGRLVALALDGEQLPVMPFPRRKRRRKKDT
ncbi:MAG: hypothetical protein R3C13_05600 [Hyphomonas sp.]|uniref:hypothetical protein n=1 Tax=Hyphomonas sp. TaxID=87 RepID=UPI0035281B9A